MWFVSILLSPPFVLGKSEARISKSETDSKSEFPNHENAPHVSWRVLSFQFGTFDIVSDFELRISSFVSAV